MKRTRMRQLEGRLIAFVVGTLLAGTVVGAVGGAEWRNYGGDQGSHKYAPLDQINAYNVSSLQVAWSWDSPDNELVAKDPSLTPWGFKSSPLMIDGVLYISTSLNQVAAINASTHAKTGKPDPNFGDNGVVDLAVGLGREINRRLYSVISAPMVIKDVVVVGSSISDGPRQKEMPPGHVRGFDVRTGAQRWIFHTIPQGDEFGADTWENDSWKYSGNTNVWTVMSADPELGYVYLPTGTPTNDWYAGHRLGDNELLSKVVFNKVSQAAT
ncbi:MAG: hypothetical protein IH908_01305 [Proteobacteria bacterium]|nr:hypothetical protein [Pseudomonadota bacterium]